MGRTRNSSSSTWFFFRSSMMKITNLKNNNNNRTVLTICKRLIRQDGVNRSGRMVSVVADSWYDCKALACQDEVSVSVLVSFGVGYGDGLGWWWCRWWFVSARVVSERVGVVDSLLVREQRCCLLLRLSLFGKRLVFDWWATGKDNIITVVKSIFVNDHVGWLALV